MTIGQAENHTSRERPEGRPAAYGIRALAAEFGITPRTIRFYEDAGLLAPARAGQVRVYSHRDRARLILICRAKRLGFSLAEIKDYLDLYDVDEDQLSQMSYGLRVTRAHIRSLEAQHHDLEATLAELRALAEGFAEKLRRAGLDPDQV